MARLRVFVSSTCYDLAVLRNQLRTFIEGQGHEPVMSDYNDVLYDPRHHTHTSCIDEVTSCDVVAVIIGSRFGGSSVPEALERIDFENLATLSNSSEILKTKDNISITQLEVLKAVQHSIPVFAFVEDRVWHDHATYEKNKLKTIINDIEFSSIEKPSTARFIFEFINFLRHRNKNNGVISFARYEDIEKSLAEQWSSLLKRMLAEQRRKSEESRQIDMLSEQFEDLKGAILSTIGDDTRRKVARGVIEFRKLYDFFSEMENHVPGAKGLVITGSTWEDIMKSLDIVDHGVVSRERAQALFPDSMARRVTALLVKSDGTIYTMHFPLAFKSLQDDFNEFSKLSKDNREIIVEALEEGRPAQSRRSIVYTGKQFDELVDITIIEEILKSERETQE